MFTTMTTLILLLQVTVDRDVSLTAAPGFTVSVFRSVEGDAAGGSEFLVCVRNDRDGTVMLLNRCWVRDAGLPHPEPQKDPPEIAGLTIQEANGVKAVLSQGLSVEIELASESQIQLPRYLLGGKLQLLDVAAGESMYLPFRLPGSVVTDPAIRYCAMIKSDGKVLIRKPFAVLRHDVPSR